MILSLKNPLPKKNFLQKCPRKRELTPLNWGRSTWMKKSFQKHRIPEKKSSKDFGVLALAGLFAKRWTFYIDSSGVIRYIDKKVETSTHGEDVVRKLAELGFARR